MFAKVNPKCHMSYSIIFTEISLSPELQVFKIAPLGYLYNIPSKEVSRLQ